MAAVMAYALEHLDARLDVNTLAEQAHLSRRTFDRRFRALTAVSPRPAIHRVVGVSPQAYRETFRTV